MRMRTILSLCCFLALLLTGATLFAEPSPAPAAPVLDSGIQPAAAPFCPAPAISLAAKPDLGGPTESSSCPATVWQQCYQRYGTCTLCYCLGACYCENRCV